MKKDTRIGRTKKDKDREEEKDTQRWGGRQKIHKDKEEEKRHTTIRNKKNGRRDMKEKTQRYG